MNGDDIIKMAREAGMDVDENTSYWGAIITAEPANLERFVDLVRADEREACAKVCESLEDAHGWSPTCANAIRARGQK